MKRPKTFMLLSIIVAILLLSIVYAAITANFSISATATIAPDQSNFKVNFSRVIIPTINSNNPTSFASTVAADAVDNVTATLASDKLSATINASGFSTKGDYSVVIFEIENSSQDFYANISTGFSSSASCFDIIVSKDCNANGVGDTVFTSSPKQSIAPSSKGYFAVIIQLNKTIINDISATVTINFAAAASDTAQF